ncbi:MULTISPECIES: DUF429 domain-containing protein [unclassified Exiguobacterium]|uniref:DUF429 domain-containing protein n=1 Tax=unclassified Exiguobacterium TaxID=2644629 RepID=UPI0010399EC6|nr:MULTISPECIES: DUF429 domain-containing protein [unclassified Exiguobacterium]TCI39414.1 DUF429 domain-containing protein [Exiguobacterium sp. SH4S7]TCI47890.1 DUF429 domain-containing protein [Exiguobacterium sp. SH5S32]TCI52265.1 DUF429 domain-containing protein [Exiguobacterium sp. SH1S21]TCI54774.1 DUF429 domain-containing protein [Exiguobacterium sp. SH1S4]TCI61625.1 DUF429 domain-containing protein [Exiguobacterium sp. SH0S2]
MVGVGIDGARGGWVRITYDSISLCLTISEQLEDLLIDGAMHFVDMPNDLGTISNPDRTCDAWMRAQLKQRKSSIFTPPIQDVVMEQTYEAANVRSRELIGKGISKQAWNLVPRIREFQTITAEDVYESHPEVCFAVMTGHEADFSKKTEAGEAERIELLRRYSKSSPWKWKMSNVKVDDIIDACILAVAAYEAGTTGLETHPHQTEGLPFVAVPKTKER